MNSSKLYITTFLVPAALLDEAIICVPNTARIGICINDVTTFQVDNIYRLLFFKPAGHLFYLAVPAHTASDTLLNDAVLALFNHPQYTIREKKPEVILIYEEPDERINFTTIQAFYAKVQAQGWAGVHLINFFKTLYSIQRNGVFSLTVQAVEELTIFSSLSPFTDISALAGTHFIMRVNNLQLIPSIHKELAKVEEALIAKTPKIYDVYLKLAQAQKELQETKEQLQFSDQQLENLKLYNTILKSEDQTRRILEFYHSEYEVLPLWYKRFGHIIKVLAGKRSFRSLFDNAAKKTTS